MLASRAFADCAQAVYGFALFGEEGLRCISLFGRHDNGHADTAVEGAVHFLLLHVAGLLQPLEQLGQRPGLGVDLRHAVFGSTRRDVFGEAAAGNGAPCL